MDILLLSYDLNWNDQNRFALSNMFSRLKCWLSNKIFSFEDDNKSHVFLICQNPKSSTKIILAVSYKHKFLNLNFSEIRCGLLAKANFSKDENKSDWFIVKKKKTLGFQKNGQSCLGETWISDVLFLNK